MIPISALLVLLSSFLPNSTLAFLGNEGIGWAQYAHERALHYGVDEKKFLKLMACESSISFAKGDYRLETDEYMAHGPLQWWMKSWEKYSNKYDFSGSYSSGLDQIELALIVISKEKRGIDNWWNCGHTVGFYK